MGNVNPDVRAIFCKAIDQKSPEETAKYLDAACGDDTDLRAQVESLLNSHREAGGFLGGPPPKEGATIDEPITEKPGTEIGPYKLLQEIGEGGMGVVYLAEQTEPVRRRVALKIIKPGMDTRQVIARFEAERQALAMMDHPNIAKVLDAGTTDSGRPYFVMELVKGIPITEYCDEHQLTPRQRLELFLPVCQAVQHAHQKGIIHRDIKPTNVMIAEYDDRPVPKIIDFGVAKAIEQRLTEKTMFTQLGQLVGTMDYMSPEQAKLNHLDIDTRSDIYSLGVLLYELLTGETPFDRERLRSAAFDELLRIIREEEPPKPSMRLSTSDTLPSTAANRQIEPKKLSTLVHGELDWIVMKALEKDRTRRYETANGLAADIGRYLNDEPVVACPPSAGYRFKKFARRNRAGLTAAALIAGALLLGTAISTWQAVRATNAEGEAVTERNAAVAARARATANLTLAMRALDEVYVDAAEEQLSRKPQLSKADRELLAKALKFYEQFADQNEGVVEARRETAKAYYRVGRIRKTLGQHKEAEEALRKAARLYEQLRADFPSAPEYRSDLADVQCSLARLLRDTGRYDEAEQRCRQAIALCEKLAAEHPNVPEYRHSLAWAYSNLGFLLSHTGRGKEAEQAQRRAMEIREKLVAECPNVARYRTHLAGSLHTLAAVLEDRGQWARCRELLEKAIAHQQAVLKSSPEDTTSRWFLSNHYGLLGVVLKKLGERASAEKAYRRSMEMREKLAAERPGVPDHRVELAASHHNLALLLMETGRTKEAEQESGRAIEIYEKLAAEFPNVLDYRDALATGYIGWSDVLSRTGRHKEREKVSRRAVELAEELAAEHPNVPEYRDSLGRAHGNLGVLLSAIGRHKEAEQVCGRVIEILEKLVAEFPIVPKYQAVLARAHGALGDALKATRRPKEAEQAYGRSIEICEKLVAEFPIVPEYQALLAQVHNSAGVLFGTGRPKEAQQQYRQAIPICEKLVKGHPSVPDYQSSLGLSLNNLGWSLMRSGQPEQAPQLLHRAIGYQQAALKAAPKVRKYRRYLRNHYINLATALITLKQYKEAEAPCRQVVATHRQCIQDFPGDPDEQFTLANPLLRLGHVLRRSRQLPEAANCALEAVDVLAKAAEAFPEAPGYEKHLARASNALNAVAWDLATCPDPKLRDPVLAVKLAKRAVALAPDNCAFWDTLGIAQYRAGEWKQAAEALAKSIDLHKKGGRAHDFFFLAMAHRKMDHQEEARTWYDKAVEWTRSNDPLNEKLHGFCAEASKLLGVADPFGSIAKAVRQPLALPEVPTGKLAFVNLDPVANHRLDKGIWPGKPDNHLGELPQGRQTFAGVDFEIGETLIQLTGSKLLPTSLKCARDIQVGRKVARLYILHGTQGAGKLSDGTEIGCYIVHYEDGTALTIPIAVGKDIRDWWGWVNRPKRVSRAVVGWEGHNPQLNRVSKPGKSWKLRLYVGMWENPHPAKQVTHVDYVLARAGAQPFCVAITVEEPAASAETKGQTAEPATPATQADPTNSDQKKPASKDSQ